MATINSIVSRLIDTLRNTHLSADKLTLKIKDPDPYIIEKEKSQEEVLHLLRDSKSLWKIDEDYSDQATLLQELLSTCSVEKFNESFFYLFIKTLRIVDKQIKTVDDTLKKFPYLEDLVLSGNFLEDVPPKLLPSDILLLELCSNCISFKDGNGMALAQGLPKLKHLGLGRNSICDISWFHPNLWSNLASLDLSNNDLSNFTDVIKKVIGLPCLKALALAGNPLALTVAYRTGTVHRLGHLSVLDDLPIAADETLNASPIAAACNLDDLCSQAMFQLRITSPVVGLPQPPMNEATQLPADWFFRIEFIVPMTLFDASSESRQMLSTVCNQPITDAPMDAAVTVANPKGTKGQAAAERLPACIERDCVNSCVRICSPGLKFQPAMAMSTLFQPIINTSALRQIRNGLDTSSSFRIAVVLLARTILTTETSRPPSGNKKDKQKDKEDKDHDKQAKDAGKDGKGRRGTQAVVEGVTTVWDRVVLAESAFSTGSIVSGSTSSVTLKINVPSANIQSIVDQLEKSRPPSVIKGKGAKRADATKSPKGDRKSPKGDRGKSPHGDRKSPRGDKTPPPGGKKAGAIPPGGQAPTGEAVPPPPPPDLQVSFAFEYFRIRSTSDVHKWTAVTANTASVMTIPEK